MQFRDLGVPQSGCDHANPLLAELCQTLADGDVGLTSADLEQLTGAIHSYQRAMDEEFGPQHDNFRLIGEDNFRRYLPVPELRVRLHAEDSRFDILARICAARTAGCRVTVSKPHELPSPLFDALEQATHSWAGSIEFVEESDEALADLVRLRQTDRLRYAAPDRVPIAIREAVIEHSIYVADAPVLMHGRVELMWYVREQSVCIDYHRYGNLGTRTDEERTEPL